MSATGENIERGEIWKAKKRTPVHMGNVQSCVYVCMYVCVSACAWMCGCSYVLTYLFLQGSSR